MKVLIVSNQFNNNLVNGGTLCNERNRLYFERYFGKENVIHYQIKKQESRKSHFINSIKKIVFGANKEDVECISKILNKQGIDILFFSNTFNGDLIEKFRNEKIIVFAHNVEFLYIRQEIKKFNMLKRLAFYSKVLLTKRNEKKSIKYSEMFFALNEHDSLEFDNVYGRFNKKILPMSMKDYCKATAALKTDGGNSEEYLLFVGSDFYGNTDGIFWFIKNVLDYIPYKLIVCGYGMDKYNECFPGKNVVFYGYVNSLSEYYQDASIVILPIISGSGMKTKTAEALMYGKYIIGTREAFCGYDLEIDKVGALCDTKEEFIDIITKFHNEKHLLYNEYSRKVFEEKYSDEQVYKLFEKYIGEFLKYESLSEEVR